MILGCGIAQSEEGTTKSSILIVGDAPDEMPSLRGMLVDNGFDVQQCRQADMPLDLSNHDAVVVYIHAVIRPEVEKALIDYVKRGGRMLVLHHALASAKMSNPKWLETMGVSIAPRDASAYPWRVSSPVTFTMVNLAPDHPVTRDGVTYDRKVEYRSPDREAIGGELPAFDLIDTEVFQHQRHKDGDAKTLLFGYRITDPETGAVCMEDTAGWFKPVGDGLLFYLQAGHADHDFQNANFARVLRNCLTWSPKTP